ncbi:kanadaptin-like [Diadema antillarum]|uniref:kanadaptin-like n=1 Tax=Diadema antillarum TaxID=105358 RepID=UPI003A897FE7
MAAPAPMDKSRLDTGVERAPDQQNDEVSSSSEDSDNLEVHRSNRPTSEQPDSSLRRHSNEAMAARTAQSTITAGPQPSDFERAADVGPAEQQATSTVSSTGTATAASSLSVRVPAASVTSVADNVLSSNKDAEDAQPSFSVFRIPTSRSSKNINSIDSHPVSSDSIPVNMPMEDAKCVAVAGVDLGQDKEERNKNTPGSGCTTMEDKPDALSKSNVETERTMSSSTSLAQACSTSSESGDSNKDSFAFALPKALPKVKTHSKHSAFQGGESNLKEAVPAEIQKKSILPSKENKNQSVEKEKAAVTPPLSYKEPSWSGLPSQEYHLEVLKNGTIVSRIALNDKPFHVFGRLAACDVQLDHPSLSRYHLILQYRLVGDSDHDPGFYVYDLGSTHGSFLNKHKLNAKAFYRMKVGHLFKLGGSTRLFILQGPPDDQEQEAELSITELKELRNKQMLEAEEKKRRKQEEEEMEKEKKKLQEEKSGGIDWGMGWDEPEDDDEEPDAENPFSMETQEEREASYVKDPKKTLRGFFEREDIELEYEVDEKQSGYSHQYVCRVQLPLDDAMGNPIYAEAAVSGKKKEAVVACALEACRILDAHGVLRQATHESKKRKAKDWAQDDYYDSDDDTYLDRTGIVEKKRKQRMKKAGVIEEKAETFDSLTAKLSEVDKELEKAEIQLEEAKKAKPASGSSDSLDDFIASLKAGGTSHDRAQRAKLKLKVVDLRKEQFRLQKLVQLARPASMPEAPKTKILPRGKLTAMVGSMKSRTSFKDKFKPKIQIAPLKSEEERASNFQEEEEEEEDEEEDEESVKELKTQREADHSIQSGAVEMQAVENVHGTEEKQTGEGASASSWVAFQGGGAIRRGRARRG